MPAKRFEVGRRVRKRGTAKRGRITSIDNAWLTAVVNWDDKMFEFGKSGVLIETLKLLKPRPKEPVREAREWTVRFTNIGFGHGFVIDHGQTIMGKEAFTVIEKIPNTVQVSREMLEKAFIQTLHNSGVDRFPGLTVENFFKTLGLKESAES